MSCSKLNGMEPFLQHYPNFWVANLAERMWLLMGIKSSPCC